RNDLLFSRTKVSRILVQYRTQHRALNKSPRFCVSEIRSEALAPAGQATAVLGPLALRLRQSCSYGSREECVRRVRRPKKQIEFLLPGERHVRRWRIRKVRCEAQGWGITLALCIQRDLVRIILRNRQGSAQSKGETQQAQNSQGSSHLPSP